MSDHSQTAANKPSEPILCKMGCGFFGNGATEGCCSKCWRDFLKKNVPPAARSPKQSIPVPAEEPQAMEVEPQLAVVPIEEKSSSEPIALKKKKTKKASYKSMMAGMMKGSDDRDVEKEKESLRKVTGGGAFSKIDKI